MICFYLLCKFPLKNIILGNNGEQSEENKQKMKKRFDVKKATTKIYIYLFIYFLISLKIWKILEKKNTSYFIYFIIEKFDNFYLNVYL